MEKIYLVILGSVVVNYLLGVLIHINRDFNFKKLSLGLFVLIKKEIALIVVIFGYLYLEDVVILNVMYSAIFYFIALLSVVYHLNSILLNVCNMLGFKNVRVIGELDEKFKELMNKSFVGGKDENSRENIQA